MKIILGGKVVEVKEGDHISAYYHVNKDNKVESILVIERNGKVVFDSRKSKRRKETVTTNDQPTG